MQRIAAAGKLLGLKLVFSRILVRRSRAASASEVGDRTLTRRKTVCSWSQTP
jgi:hypothetical protein